MTRLLNCPRCQGKGYLSARGFVRIGSTHCGNVKLLCQTCRRTGKITEQQLQRLGDSPAT